MNMRVDSESTISRNRYGGNKIGINKEFQKITAVTLPIGTVNILVGENSSGKSSILQAVHLAACAIRQASEVRTERSVTIPITEIDYIPTNIYRKLGKGREWGNTDTQPETRVEFEFSDKESKASAYCRLKSARNSAGISIKGNIPSNLQQSLRRRNSFFTAYIPGLAGIPNAENYLPRRSIDKISASGESNSAFRNILLRLNQSDKAYYKEIINHLKELIGDIDIRTNFNERTDLQIECNAWISGQEIPIKLLGSGHLKLIHILSYLYFYKPTLLLVDEPDAHLHPTVQERLIGVIQSAAKPLGTKILICTHTNGLLM